jgi:hypothetical protein
MLPVAAVGNPWDDGEWIGCSNRPAMRPRGLSDLVD